MISGQINSKDFKKLLRAGEIRFAGNVKLKIYGTLKCASGRRMDKRHRVFFSTAEEAVGRGFRPCGNCLRKAFREWKKTFGLLS